MGPAPVRRSGAARGGLLRRPRLLAQLDRAFGGRVVLVTAGAGYGKTCLVASWSDQQSHEVDILWASPSREGELDLAGAAAELAERTRGGRRRGVIVIDDPAREWPSPTIDQITTQLATAPRELSLIVASRDSRSEPWAKLKASGRLVRIGTRDLAFDDEEAGEFLGSEFDLALAPEACARVNQQAEGWAAGLRLAGEELRRVGGSMGTLGTWPARSRALEHYVETEITASVTPEDLEFAELTSELPSLEPGLCDHLTGRGDSDQRLDRFVVSNFFTAHVTDPPGAYRYHALVAGVLGRRSRRRDPDGVPRALRTASDWYLAAGDTDRAVEAALRAGDGPRVASLLRSVSGAKLRAGQAALLVSWLERMPQADLWNDPALALALARACGLAGDSLTPRAVLRATEADMAAMSDPPIGLRIARAQLESSARGWEGRLATMGDPLLETPPTLGPLAQDPVLEMCAIDETALSNSRVRALLLTGRLEEALRATEAILTPAEIQNPSRYTVVAVGLRAMSLAWLGQLPQAREAVRQGMRVLRRYHGTGTDALWLHIASAWVADRDDALESLARVEEYTARSGLPYMRALSALAACALHLRLENEAEAARAFAAAEREVASLPEPAFLATLVMQLRTDPRLLPEPTEALIPQEVAMIKLLAQGATRPQIAALTSYSVNTVKAYLRSAYRKLGVVDRDQAVTAAVALGIVDRAALSDLARRQQ